MPSPRPDAEDSPSAAGKSLHTTLLFRLQANENDAWRRLDHLYGPVVVAWCRGAGLPAVNEARHIAELERKIGPQTKALYLTHYAGFPGPAAEMKRLAEKHGLVLIEDCALSLLSADGERPLGTTGEVSVFCLYKTIPVPNGGALVINGPRHYSLPAAAPPPWISTLSHAGSALLQNLELRAGPAGRWIRATARRLAGKTVQAAGIERIGTGTQHFNRAHVDLGISSLSMRIAQAQDLASIVDARRRNFFYLLGRLRDISPPLFNQLPAGVCPLFYPLAVEDKSEVMLISQYGKIIRIESKYIRESGRSAQGVRLLQIEPGDRVAAAVVIPPEEEPVNGALIQ